MQTLQYQVDFKARLEELDKSIAKAEQLAATNTAIESQTQVIAQTRFELTQAQIAGDDARVRQLQSELAIRGSTLGVMRAETLTAAQLNALTETEAALLAKSAVATEATAAGGLLAGASLNKAKGEAIVLGRELATGSVNARTMGALLGSLGSSLTIAGIAGYALFSVISNIFDERARVLEETKKENDELERQRDKWNAIAAGASTFADVVRLGAEEVTVLDRKAQSLQETIDKQARKWDHIKDAAIDALRFVGGLNASSGVGTTSEEEKKAEATRKALELRKQLNEAEAASKKAEANANFLQELQLEPAAVAVEKITEKLAGLYEEEKKLKAAAGDKLSPALNWADPQQELARAKANRDLQTIREQIQSLEAASKKFSTAETQGLDQITKLHLQERQAEIDIAKARGEDVTTAQHQLDIEKKIAELTKENKQALKDGLTTNEQIKADAEQQVTAAENLHSARSGLREDQRDYNALLHDESVLLRGIRLEQQTIAENPGLTPEEKERALVATYEKEKQAIDKLIDEYEAYILAHKAAAASDEDEARKLDDLIAKIDELRAHRQQLTFKEGRDGSFLGDFKTELQQWVDNFGTAGEQAGKLIEGSLGASLQGVNQLLLDSIFRTGNWKQALLGVEEQILNLFLTYIEQMILQNTIGRSLHTAAVSQQVAAGPVIAAAHAPAAAATSISTSGVAAIIGEVLAVAAIAAIIAALVGGFEEGGFTGRRRRRDGIAGVVHDDEFVFTADATRNAGIENLYAMMHAAEKGPVQFMARASGASGNAGGGHRLPAGFDVNEVPGNIEPGLLPGGDTGGHLPTGGQPGDFHGSWDVPMGGEGPGYQPGNQPHSGVDYYGPYNYPHGGVDYYDQPGNQPHSGVDYYDQPGNHPHSGVDYYDQPPNEDSTSDWRQSALGHHDPSNVPYGLPVDPGSGHHGWGFGTPVHQDRFGNVVGYLDSPIFHTGFQSGPHEGVDITQNLIQSTILAHHQLAKGSRIPPGYPNDTYPASLTSGEAVLSAPAVALIDRQHPGLIDSLLSNMRVDVGPRLHMADGGRVGSSSGASGSRDRSFAGNVDIGVYAVVDPDKLVQMLRNSPHGRNYVVDILRDAT